MAAINTPIRCTPQWIVNRSFKDAMNEVARMRHLCAVVQFAFTFDMPKKSCRGQVFLQHVAEDLGPAGADGSESVATLN